MLIANNWREYEILDTGDGDKLERWGVSPNSYILSRPDPQILWPKEHPKLWSEADGVYTRSAKGGGSWSFPKLGRKPSDKSEIKYKLPNGADKLNFLIKPTDFKHMGLFPEQAVNWEWMMEKVKSYKVYKAPRVLNLFAYTGGATIACAKAGAEVTHVDSAKGMIGWASDNAKLNGVEARWIIDDVLKFVEREERRGEKYDAIIMDPPSYGRGGTGETWKIEKMLWPLTERCERILSDKPLFFIINSYTTGLGVIAIKNILMSAMKNRDGKITSDELALPIKNSDKLLPAGVSTRWAAN